MRRRFCALALLVLFLLQSSGAATAAAPVANPLAPALLAQAQLGFSAALRSFENTYIGALFTGQAERYAAMHAPPPARLRMQDTGITPMRSRAIHDAPWRLISVSVSGVSYGIPRTVRIAKCGR